MQASQRLRTSSMSNTMYYQPVQKAETYCLPQFQNLDHQPSFTNNSINGGNHAIHPHCASYYTEFSLMSRAHGLHNSSSTLSFSPNGNSVSQQESQAYISGLHQSPATTYSYPIRESCFGDEVNDLDFKDKLRELETVMLGPGSDIVESYANTIVSPEIDSWEEMIVAIPRGDLKQLLVACAKAVSDNDLLTAQSLMSELWQMVSVSGEPIQRLGAYMLEGLVARLPVSETSIYKSPRCKKPSSFELLSSMHILNEVCPYFKFGYMSANGAIAEAMKDEKRVHIIDFQIGQGSQWVTLIQAFAARPGGPPEIRITGIDDSTSAYARRGGLSIVGKNLSNLAESFKVPFQFHAVTMPGCKAQLENLTIQRGEALAVNFAFMLHRMPDESVSTSTDNPRGHLLRLVKSLNPKVVTLVEHESQSNSPAFYPRFLEALDYYSAMFESLDMTLPRNHKQRINVEQHCLGRDVVNIIACEGTERVKRHELLDKWKSRFRMAGFSPYPLSSLVNGTIKTLLENYSDKYRLEERDGALYLGWRNRDLVASCAWK
ncbi:scarecrow-like protein 21 [Ipomoea triloba]|uniref:scarecrow-like protein 21 n=1 Tax=Ipomoea triloba TaxID=35885 RepID=UPI00125D6EA5|nr:scarecrow-like protein 21 [Ipomoea triloba]XP_031092609.1 scarecrow-like protein 21 [Ipomoea triloba]XP_031092610.1 scarecrow-like protein 21 [Ipomoea triloba]XP_031092612.1 scarecrow-like protein 21 [Ipomoea triloba]